MPITYDLSKDVRFKQGKQEASLIKDQYFVINLLQKGIVCELRVENTVLTPFYTN